MRLPEPVGSWYAGLAKREQRLVAICAAAVVLLIVYLAVIQPLVSAHERLDRELRADHSLLVYLDRAAGRLGSTGSTTAGPGKLTGSVFSAVSTAAQEPSINNAVQRLEQADNGGVRLTLNAVSFDALVRWLESLSDNQGIRVETANIQGAQAPGTVNATLTLNVRS